MKENQKELGDQLGDDVLRCGSLETRWQRVGRCGQAQENLVDGINLAGDGLETEGMGAGKVRNHRFLDLVGVAETEWCHFVRQETREGVAWEGGRG